MQITTATAATTTAKSHIDGGTFRSIKFAETTARWGVAITEWTTYRGEVLYEVLRVAPDGMSLRLSLHRTEAAARKAANTAWRNDR